jgi:hypothetical protein
VAWKQFWNIISGDAAMLGGFKYEIRRERIHTGVRRHAAKEHAKDKESVENRHFIWL